MAVKMVPSPGVSGQGYFPKGEIYHKINHRSTSNPKQNSTGRVDRRFGAPVVTRSFQFFDSQLGNIQILDCIDCDFTGSWSTLICRAWQS